MKNEVTGQTIAEQRADIFEVVYGVSRMADILKLFAKDYDSCKNTSVPKVRELYRNYSYAIFFMYSPSSIRNNLVKFKKIIEANGGKYQDMALADFTIANIYAPIKKKDIERKVELKEALRSNVSESSNIENVDIVKNKIIDLKSILDEKKYLPLKGNQREEQVRAYHIVAILGLAIGRRFTELLKTLVLSKRKEKLFFTGLLKGNEEKIEANIILLEYAEVQSFLRELRRFVKTDNLTPSEINSKYAKVFNNGIKRIGFVNVKTLRHNYTIAGSQIFRRDNENTEDTITRMLGHKEVFTSALNYT